MKLSILIFCFLTCSNFMFGQASLNNMLSTYSANIKVCNAPYAKSCIYETNYVRVNKAGNILRIEYGFAWNKERRDYITTNTINVNLKSASFFTGFWQNMWGKWEHYGKKNELTIRDEDGIDLFVTGQQNYNKGTKQNLITEIVFDLGTEPVANRVLKELLALQEGYKEKDPWFLPTPQKAKDIHEAQQAVPSTRKSVSQKKKSQVKSHPKTTTTKKSKSGKYVQ